MNLQKTLRLHYLSERALIVKDPRYLYSTPFGLFTGGIEDEATEEIWEEI